MRGPRAAGLWHVGLFSLCAAFLACVAESVVPDETEDPEEEESVEGDEGSEDTGVFSYLDFGLEADVEFVHENDGGEITNELSFSEFGFSVGGPWWMVDMGIRAWSSGSGSVAVEDAALEVGDTERWPWSATLGRTVLPFAEFNSEFAEDPIVTAIGEISAGSVVLGFSERNMEIAAGVFDSRVGEPDDFEAGDDGPDDFDFTAAGTASLWGNSGLHLSWTSDLGESEELQDLHDEAVEAGSVGGDSSFVSGVSGLGASIHTGAKGWQVRVDYVSALGSFPGGFLDEESHRPSAWNLELAVRPMKRWVFAGRVESSDDLPSFPKRQWGVSASYTFWRYATAGCEFLRGELDGGGETRDRASAKIAFEF